MALEFYTQTRPTAGPRRTSPAGRGRGDGAGLSGAAVLFQSQTGRVWDIST